MVVQVQALAGDSTDNMPGVRGIGVKTAAELINTYRRSRNASEARGRDQAAQAARNPDRECRRSRAFRSSSSRSMPTCADDEPIDGFGTPRARSRNADRLPEGDGVQFAHPPRRHPFRRRRCRRDCAIGRSGTRRIAPTAAAQGRDPAAAPKPAAKAPASVPGAVKDRDKILRAIDHDAYKTVTTPKRTGRMDRARARGRHGLRRYRNHLARSDAGGACAACRWRSRRARPATSPAATAMASSLRSNPAATHRADGRGRGAGRAEAAAGRRRAC